MTMTRAISRMYGANSIRRHRATAGVRICAGFACHEKAYVATHNDRTRVGTWRCGDDDEESGFAFSGIQLVGVFISVRNQPSMRLASHASACGPWPVEKQESTMTTTSRLLFAVIVERNGQEIARDVVRVRDHDRNGAAAQDRFGNTPEEQAG